MTEFRFRSHEIQYHCERLLEDERVHCIQDIKNFIESQSGRKFGTYFSKGMLAGVLRKLSQKPQYINIDPGRGIYIKYRITV
jgi:hypothetical protein